MKADLPHCDVVMKGGITSGLVYPLAIRELANKYRLHNIGGTSAGAVAAAIAAAAEYRRQHEPDMGIDAYKIMDEIPKTMSKDLLTLFQPMPDMRPLFEMLIAVQKGKTPASKVGGAVLAGVRGYPLLAAGAGVLVGLGLPQVALALGLKLGVGFRALLPVLGGGAGLSAGVVHAIGKELPANGFGLCTGLQQPGYSKPAVTDWLADAINRAAGRDLTTDPPLTFGDLEDKGIHLQMMTTNLSMCRPYRLPFGTKIYEFRRRDFAKLFPKRILDHLCKEGPKHDDFYRFPTKEDLPVVVAARMSLSFPGLISAVPLYAVDYTKREKKSGVCWFSDGGLSSNFPIHLFDQLLPNTPTFGISLEPWHDGDDDVWLPPTSGAGTLLRIYPIEGVGSFVMTLLNSAKDWQDNLQSSLPGYRERIVRVKLREEEGGLNLNMPPETIDALAERGQEAGAKLCEDFDLNEHRWRRFLIVMASLDQTLTQLAAADDSKSIQELHSFQELLQPYLQDPKKPKSYKQTKKWLEQARERFDDLVQLGRKWRDDESSFVHEKLPKPETDFRIVPKDVS